MFILLLILCYNPVLIDGKKYVINVSKLPMSLHLNFNGKQAINSGQFQSNDNEIVEETFCTCGKSERTQGRIWGGQPTSTYKYPWHVTLGDFDVNYSNKTRNYCGGVLISKRHVITAYHCITKWYKIGMHDRIFAIGHTYDRNREMVLVKRVDRHPKNRDGMIKAYDIALLTLNQDVYGVMPICLPNPRNHGVFESDGNRLIAIGTGYQGPDTKWDKRLQEADLNSLSQESCKRFYDRSPVKIMPYHICAISQTADTCVGDSGGKPAK